MKDNFKEQFENLRLIIRGNLSTIRSLVKQSENLSKIIEILQKEKSEKNIELERQLEECKEKLGETVSELTNRTEELFNTYNKLIEQVFGKQ